jgi:hypothetical protein
LLRHSRRRLQDLELQCVSTPRQLLALGDQPFLLTACDDSTARELLILRFPR